MHTYIHRHIATNTHTHTNKTLSCINKLAHKHVYRKKQSNTNRETDLNTKTPHKDKHRKTEEVCYWRRGLGQSCFLIGSK